MASLKTKRNAGCKHVAQRNSSSLASRREAAGAHVSMTTVRVDPVRHPVLQGIGSLGNISGGYVRFRRYMSGNYILDLRSDWQRVGEFLRESMSSVK